MSPCAWEVGEAWSIRSACRALWECMVRGNLVGCAAMLCGSLLAGAWFLGFRSLDTINGPVSTRAAWFSDRLRCANIDERFPMSSFQGCRGVGQRLQEVGSPRGRAIPTAARGFFHGSNSFAQAAARGPTCIAKVGRARKLCLIISWNRHIYFSWKTACCLLSGVESVAAEGSVFRQRSGRARSDQLAGMSASGRRWYGFRTEGARR